MISHQIQALNLAIDGPKAVLIVLRKFGDHIADHCFGDEVP